MRQVIEWKFLVSKFRCGSIVARGPFGKDRTAPMQVAEFGSGRALISVHCSRESFDSACSAPESQRAAVTIDVTDYKRGVAQSRRSAAAHQPIETQVRNVCPRRVQSQLRRQLLSECLKNSVPVSVMNDEESIYLDLRDQSSGADRLRLSQRAGSCGSQIGRTWVLSLNCDYFFGSAENRRGRGYEF